MQKGNVHSLHPTVYLESVLKEHAKACEGEYSSNIPHIFFLFLFPFLFISTPFSRRAKIQVGNEGADDIWKVVVCDSVEGADEFREQAHHCL